MTPALWMAAIIGLAATAEDLARRRISNWIPVTALLCGVIYGAFTSGWRGAGMAVLGAVCGFAVFLVLYLLGGMGGGDVKLMSGFGAILGPGQLLEAALWTAACGGLLALLVLGCRRLRGLWRAGRSEHDSADKEFIPYAPAISLGVILALLPKS